MKTDFTLGIAEENFSVMTVEYLKANGGSVEKAGSAVRFFPAKGKFKVRLTVHMMLGMEASIGGEMYTKKGFYVGDASYAFAHKPWENFRASCGNLQTGQEGRRTLFLAGLAPRHNVTFEMVEG